MSDLAIQHLRGFLTGRVRPNGMRVLLALMDAMIFNACVVVAILLHFDGGVPVEYWNLWVASAWWVTATLLLVSFLLGLYNRIWQYASLEAALTIFASVTGTVLTFAIIMGALGGTHYPLGVLVMVWSFSMLAIGATRFGWRMFRTRVLLNSDRGNGKRSRVAAYGAGRAGVMFAREAEQDPQSPYDVVGFIHDDIALKGMYAAGYKILGTSEQLPEIARTYNLDEIVVAVGCEANSEQKLQQIVRSGAALGLKVRTLPRLLEMVGSQRSATQLRDIDVSDLLRHSPSCPNLDLPHDYISGRTVLVTGAGGSIGSEICRQLCRYNPGRLLLLGRGENRIHKTYYELRDRFPHLKTEPVICNIASPPAVEDVLRRHRPDVIFHTAAHKHVFLMERNPVEAADNNVLGTATLADLAKKSGVDRFVLISTDKATEPTSVMGATKAFCERLVARKNGSKGTKFIAVRFGNVLGSAGSVVPIFQALMAQNKPLTVTDPEADRYFMTIEEASFLVLQAGALGHGGEVFVLDMGEPVKIVEIARTILRMHGKDPDEPGAINFIGLRPGEKLHERLVNPHEELVDSGYPRVREIRTNGQVPDCMDIDLALGEMRQAVQNRDEARVLDILARSTNAQFNEETGG